MQTPAGYAFSREAWGQLSKEKRDEAREHLAELGEAVRRNPLHLYNNPLLLPREKIHEPQLRFHASRARKRLFLGGNRSGKTTGGVVDNVIQALPREFVPSHLLEFKRREAPFDCRIVIPDLGATLTGVHMKKIRQWCPREALLGGSLEKAWDKTERKLRFACGSEFQYMSHEQDLDKFGGADLHRIHCDEEPPQDIFDECMMRLIDHGGDTLITMTPVQGLTWTYEEFWEPWEQAVSVGETPANPFIVVVDMDDNPYLNEEAKQEELARYSVEQRQARKSGRFVHFEGLIYSEFHEDTHVIPEFTEADPGWLTYEGIDPGWRYMAAIVFVAMLEDGTCIVFDEIAEPRKTVDLLAKEVHLRRERWEIHPEWSVIDPSARNKMNQTGRSDQMEWAEHGIPTIPGQNAVRPGINRVKQRLEVVPPRLLICANCTTTIRQFHKYRWKSERGRSREAAEIEQPIKRDDHCLDALRYVLMSLPRAPEAGPDPDERSPAERAMERSMDRHRKNKAAGEFGPGIYA